MIEDQYIMKIFFKAIMKTSKSSKVKKLIFFSSNYGFMPLRLTVHHKKHEWHYLCCRNYTLKVVHYVNYTKKIILFSRNINIYTFKNHCTKFIFLKQLECVGE